MQTLASGDLTAQVRSVVGFSRVITLERGVRGQRPKRTNNICRKVNANPSVRRPDRTGAVRSLGDGVCICHGKYFLLLSRALPPENPHSRVITLENPAADRAGAVRSLGDGVCIVIDRCFFASFWGFAPENPHSKVITLENPTADRASAVRSLGDGICICHRQINTFM